MNYPKEYLEAISRLEAPERPYQVQYLKKIPYFECPDHTTEAEWEDVLHSGNNTKLPKYSIPQRIYINPPDVGKDVYNFDLDKAFVNAMGNRKSIAIRDIHFNSPGNADGAYGNLGKFTGQINLVADTGYTIDGKAVKLAKESVSIPTKVVATAWETIRTEISHLILRLLTRVFHTNLILESKLIDTNKKLRYIINGVVATPNVEFPKLKFIGTFNDPTVQEMVFGTPNIIEITPAISHVEGEVPGTTVSYIFPFQDFHIPASVCATLNPYSVQNIIGSLQESHDMLNKMYPYDQQPNFQLWFNDCEGKRIMNKNITGWIDLELIVDSSNNINLYV